MGAEDPDLSRLLPYDYVLPKERIALRPPEARDGGRLLEGDLTGWRDAQIVDLPRLLRAGDLLVVNDTRVLAARLRARRATGGVVELLLLEGAGDIVPALVMPGRKIKPGEVLQILGPDGEVLPDVHATVGTPFPDGRRMVSVFPSPMAVMDAAGVVPLPPYIDRPPEASDALRYQTVFAKAPGAVAAPTAGLHLSERLLLAVKEAGVEIATLTLHVGPGTFRSLRPADLDRGVLHGEPFELPEATAEAIERTRARGGRVVAVGTTVTRTLETQALDRGRVRPGTGATDLFIRPGHRFAVVDALLTNFHLPRSSLLMLVCAMGGRDHVIDAYAHAVAAQYRFYSYGDAMFLTGFCPRRDR